MITFLDFLSEAVVSTKSIASKQDVRKPPLMLFPRLLTAAIISMSLVRMKLLLRVFPNSTIS